MLIVLFIMTVLIFPDVQEVFNDLVKQDSQFYSDEMKRFAHQSASLYNPTVNTDDPSAVCLNTGSLPSAIFLLINE